MRDIIIATILLVAWAVVQFTMEINSGWIHLALILGVLMMIRGISQHGEPRSG